MMITVSREACVIPRPHIALSGFFIAVLGLFVSWGCGHRASSAHEKHPAAGQLDVLSIGYQKTDGMHIARLRGDLERRLANEGIHVRWYDFPAGPQRAMILYRLSRARS